MIVSVLTNTPPRDVECVDKNSHQQYGVLLWRIGRHGNLRILLITDRNQQKWGVPKGRPKKGRLPLMSVALDAFEDAGIIGEIDPRPLTDYGDTTPAGDGAKLVRRVTLFAMRVRGTLLHWQDYGQRQRRWFSASEAADRLQGSELAGFVGKLISSPHSLTGR